MAGEAFGVEQPAEVLILLRYEGYWQISEVIPGSVVIKANCGHRGWISPDGQQAQARRGATMYTECTSCYGATVAAGPETDARPVEGALETIARLVGPDWAAVIAAHFTSKKRNP